VIDTLLCILAMMWHCFARVAIFWTYVWSNCIYKYIDFHLSMYMNTYYSLYVYVDECECL